MLFKNFDFGNNEAKKLFVLDKNDFSATWKYYYDSYAYALDKIIDKGLKGNYEFNCRARAFLFILRQNFELCLKLNLNLQGKEIPPTHNFDELFAFFDGNISNEVIDVFKQIDLDNDGSCFRYYSDKQANKPYFSYSAIIETCSIFRDYIRLNSKNNFTVWKSPVQIDCSRKAKWDLTIHLGECRSLGHVRTQYDMMVELLIEGVLINNFLVGKLYLPMLFLMRHSMELGLKENIFEIQKRSSIIKQKDYSPEHSLMTLYNCYFDYLSKIETSKLETGLQNQLKMFTESFAKLNNTIHQLDSNSRCFRYPVDKEGKPLALDIRKIDMIEILELYYFTDPFITFTNLVLEEQGLLK